MDKSILHCQITPASEDPFELPFPACTQQLKKRHIAHLRDLPPRASYLELGTNVKAKPQVLCNQHKMLYTLYRIHLI